MGISIWQLLILLAIVLVLFGTKKLRNLGGDLGGAIHGFKKAMNDQENDSNNENNPEEPSLSDNGNDITAHSKSPEHTTTPKDSSA